MKKLSIVVPCYNEEEALEFFYSRVKDVLSQLNELEAEIILVDDGSKDNSLKIMRLLHEKDKRVRYISFSRNFGKEAALYAGLQNAEGDYLAVMDADLQDPPELLVEMYEVLKTREYDCVATRREDRKGEPVIRSFFARCFYRLINRLSNTEVIDGARDFRMMTRQMVDAILAMSEYNRFSKGIFGWVGFETKWISYENVERIAGETKWSFKKLTVYALEGIIAFSTTPLIISSFMGLLFCAIAFLLILFFIGKTLIFGDPVPGYPSLVCIIFFAAGILLFCLGILGQYISKIYLETKNRPVYIVKSTEKDLDPEA